MKKVTLMLSILAIIASSNYASSSKKNIVGDYGCYSERDFNRKGEKNSVRQSMLELKADGTYSYLFLTNYMTLNSKWKMKNKKIVFDVQTTRKVQKEELGIKGKKLTIMAGGWLTKTPLVCTKIKD